MNKLVATNCKTQPPFLEPDSAGTNRMLLAENPGGKCYVLDEELALVKAGEKDPAPLVIRANVGDCIVVELTNRLARG